MVKEEETPSSQEVDAIIMKFADWRGEKLAQLRMLIKQADPDIIEEVKWKKASNPDGIPVWSHDGMICTGETYTSHLRLIFGKGASLHDPHGLFNAHRSMVIKEDDEINEDAFKDIIRSAVALNLKDKKKQKSS